MKLEKIEFSSIQPSEYNPRKITQSEMTSLSRNLKEFGLVDPIIINLKNNHIIGGHQRYKVLERKYKKQDDQTLHLIRLGDIGWVFEEENLKIEDEEHEKALNLSLNRISGDWDFSKLSPLLNELNNTNFNMNLTGFSKSELEKYTIPTELNLQFTEIEEIEEGIWEPVPPTQKQEEKNDEEMNADEVAVSAKEIEELHKYKCPACGYEW